MTIHHYLITIVQLDDILLLFSIYIVFANVIRIVLSNSDSGEYVLLSHILENQVGVCRQVLLSRFIDLFLCVLGRAHREHLVEDLRSFLLSSQVSRILQLVLLLDGFYRNLVDPA